MAVSRKSARGGLLAAAIRGKRWQMAALCLLLALADALSRVPPDAIEGVLDVLAGDEQSSVSRPPAEGRSFPLDGGRSGWG